MNTYVSHFEYARSPSGLEIASLLGNSARLSGAHLLGATTLVSRPATTLDLKRDDRITIFDGSSSEVVTVTAATNQPASSIPVSALAFAHADGTAWCSDGQYGSLADQIAAASSWVESTCYQSLLLTTYTGEVLDMPGIRASLSNRGALTFRPRHFPVVALSALSLGTTPTNGIAYDTTQAFITANKRLCTIKNLVALPGQGQTVSLTTPDFFDRNTEAELQITYQAGYAYNALPPDFKEAVILVTSDLLSKRYNPIGAADLGDGSTRLNAVLRGDLSGHSIHMKWALQILSRYSVEVY